MSDTVRIAMWSGPRNISTAMMRAWDSRTDSIVMDEPFYAAYLAATGLDHPMREAVIASQPTDWDVVAEQCATASGARVIFQKHMSQHMIAAAPLGWTSEIRHAFLIRPPVEVAASFHEKLPTMTPDDLGFRRQAELFEEVADRAGCRPPVILASDVLKDPGRALRALCHGLGVDYDPSMLSWSSGLRETDGVWAKHWYNAVVCSTGFAVPERRAASDLTTDELPDHVSAAIAECDPYFSTMMAHRTEV